MLKAIKVLKIPNNLCTINYPIFVLLDTTFQWTSYTTLGNLLNAQFQTRAYQSYSN